MRTLLGVVELIIAAALVLYAGWMVHAAWQHPPDHVDPVWSYAFGASFGAVGILAFVPAGLSLLRFGTWHQQLLIPLAILGREPLATLTVLVLRWGDLIA